MKTLLNRFTTTKNNNFIQNTNSFIILGLLLLAFILLIFPSCRDYEEADIITKEDIRDYCPSCSDTLRWNAYGRWRFGKTGYDGSFGSGVPVHVENTCGFKIHNGNAGGIGNTYQVYHEDCGTGVILIWKYGVLSSVSLKQGWTGSTAEGIQLGEDLEEFKTVYPNFTVATNDSLKYQLLEEKFYINSDNDTSFYQVTRAWAKFDEDKKLIQLYAD